MITNKCGVYKITNTVTGDFYIGSSYNIRKRVEQHRWHLANNRHPNHYLQNSYNKHGKQAFTFDVILLCDVNHQLYFEQGFLDLLKPAYNIAICAKTPAKGLLKSEDHKRKLSEANKGKLMTEDMKRQAREAHKGCHHTEDARRRISEANKGALNPMFGKRCSEETKRKISEVKMGHITTEETRRKMSEAHKHYSRQLLKR